MLEGVTAVRMCDRICTMQKDVTVVVLTVVRMCDRSCTMLKDVTVVSRIM